MSITRDLRVKLQCSGMYTLYQALVLIVNKQYLNIILNHQYQYKLRLIDSTYGGGKRSCLKPILKSNGIYTYGTKVTMFDFKWIKTIIFALNETSLLT